MYGTFRCPCPSLHYTSTFRCPCPSLHHTIYFPLSMPITALHHLEMSVRNISFNSIRQRDFYKKIELSLPAWFGQDYILISIDESTYVWCQGHDSTRWQIFQDFLLSRKAWCHQQKYLFDLILLSRSSPPTSHPPYYCKLF